MFYEHPVMHITSSMSMNYERSCGRKSKFDKKTDKDKICQKKKNLVLLSVFIIFRCCQFNLKSYRMDRNEGLLVYCRLRIALWTIHMGHPVSIKCHSSLSLPTTTADLLTMSVCLSVQNQCKRSQCVQIHRQFLWAGVCVCVLISHIDPLP